MFEETFSDWRCDFVALELERTFWEKATILHAEYHRASDQLTPDRLSRHYADTAALARHPATADALGNDALRNRVVEWKGKFFGSGWTAVRTGKARDVSAGAAARAPHAACA